MTLHLTSQPLRAVPSHARKCCDEVDGDSKCLGLTFQDELMGLPPHALLCAHQISPVILSPSCRALWARTIMMGRNVWNCDSRRIPPLAHVSTAFPYVLQLCRDRFFAHQSICYHFCLLFLPSQFLSNPSLPLHTLHYAADQVHDKTGWC